jgi:hypothetical protein
MKDVDRNELNPQYMLTAENSYLVEYFIEGEGAKFIQLLPDHKKLYVLSGDEEMPVIVGKNLYGEKLSYVSSYHFNSIPKSILKKESKTNRNIIRFIKKLPESIIILYYT